MRFLPLPTDAGDAIIEKQCRKPGWSARRRRWLDAASAYRAHRGNPWLVSPAPFAKIEQEALYGLYDTRAGGGPLKRIRHPEGGYGSCPMCGSLGGRSLDHALPRRHFPEFSILRENLVPACTICNSNQKGDIYRGTRRPERFIHPYYDRWAAKPLWQTRFGPDLEALQFEPTALERLPRRRRKIVQFHLDTLLGVDWRDYVRREWGGLPAKLQRRIGSAPQPEDVRAELEQRMADAVETNGGNSWEAAFHRGAMADNDVLAKLAERVENLPR